MTGCCVPMCTNNSRNGWKLYHFPTEPKRRLLWMVKIKRDKWQPTKSSCVCSAHFEASHFEQHRADQWIKLKPNAVPTVFPFRGLPPQRKAPKDRAGPAVLPDACQETRGDNSTAINCTPLTSAQANLNSRTDSLGAQQPQSCNSQTPDSVPHIMEREEVVISADAPDGARENKQLNKQLSDMGRKYTQLHQVHRKATSTIQALKKQVKKLETKWNYSDSV
nr:peroxynitrite isomerase THAP4-like [Rhipicephalus microplus]